MKSISIPLFTLFLITACSSHEIIEPDEPTPSKGRTLTVKASMPDDNPTPTRLAITEVDQNISVRWKEGDKINLCFESIDGNTIKTVSDVPAINITPDGKRAEFTITIPAEITGSFNLYGVYGATFQAADSKIVLFPTPPNGVALSEIEDMCVMRFADLNLTPEEPANVSFSHLGSIVGMWLFNAHSTSKTITSISLRGDGYQWLYNNSGAATYDIAAQTFVNAQAGDQIGFEVGSGITIASGETHKRYCWIVPTATPDLAETLTLSINGTDMATAVPAKMVGKGKYYRIKLFDNGAGWAPMVLPPSTNLASHWPFDGTAEDVAGENDGSVMAGVTAVADRFGKENSAYSFSGSGSYIRCLQPGITGTGARTFTFWAKANALSSSEQAIISYGGPITTYGGRFEISLITGQVVTDISWSNMGKLAADVTNGTWNFYTIVFTGGANQTLSTGVRIYVNGRICSTTGKITRNDVINTGTTNPIYFGTLYNTGRTFNGIIDDVRMYDKWLTQSEITALFHFQE